MAGGPLILSRLLWLGIKVPNLADLHLSQYSPPLRYINEVSRHTQPWRPAMLRHETDRVTFNHRSCNVSYVPSSWSSLLLCHPAIFFYPSLAKKLSCGLIYTPQYHINYSAIPSHDHSIYLYYIIWIIEREGRTRSDTPQHGNCQFFDLAGRTCSCVKYLYTSSFVVSGTTAQPFP